MSASNLNRMGGLALILGALLMSVSSSFRPSGGQGGSTWWLITFVGALFLLLGLPAMYAHQARQAGKLGLIGFVMTFLGCAALEVGSAVLPESQWAQIGTGFTIAFALGMVGFNLGLIVYGIATLRARVFPRWAALLIIVGVPAIFLGNLSPLIGAKPEVLIFLGLAWCGAVLWSGKGATVKQPALATA